MSAPLRGAMTWTALANDGLQDQRLHSTLTLRPQKQKGRDDAALFYVRPYGSLQEAGNSSRATCIMLMGLLRSVSGVLPPPSC